MGGKTSGGGIAAAEIHETLSLKKRLSLLGLASDEVRRGQKGKRKGRNNEAYPVMRLGP